MAAITQPAAKRRAITAEEQRYLLIQRLKSLSAHAVLIIFGIAFMLPFVWMVSSSLKPNVDIFELPVRLIPKTLRPENYIDATTARIQDFQGSPAFALGAGWPYERVWVDDSQA